MSRRQRWIDGLRAFHRESPESAVLLVLWVVYVGVLWWR